MWCGVCLMPFTFWLLIDDFLCMVDLTRIKWGSLLILSGFGVCVWRHINYQSTTIVTPAIIIPPRLMYNTHHIYKIRHKGCAIQFLSVWLHQNMTQKSLQAESNNMHGEQQQHLFPTTSYTRTLYINICLSMIIHNIRHPFALLLPLLIFLCTHNVHLNMCQHRWYTYIAYELSILYIAFRRSLTCRVWSMMPGDWEKSILRMRHATHQQQETPHTHTQ